jgi:hypothetical protein
MKYLPLVLANLGRHKKRTVLTITSVALALFLFASLQTVVAGQPRFLPTIVADKTSSNGVVSALLAALFARERTGKGQAVEVPMYANWFGGKYGDKSLRPIAVDPKSYLETPSFVPADQKQAFLQELRGAIGKGLIPVRLKLGQNVTLQNDLPRRLTFTIRVYTLTGSSDADDMMLSITTISRSAPGDRTRGWYVMRIEHPMGGDDRQDDRRPVQELLLSVENRHGTGVQRQLRDDVGECEFAHGHDRHGGSVCDPARDGECDDDERARTDA